METKKEIYYLCKSFRPVYVLKVILNGTFFKKEQITFLYLDQNRITTFIKRKQKTPERIHFLPKIKIKKLPFNFADLDHKLGWHTRKKAYVDDLYEVMRTIEKEVFNDRQSMLRFIGKKLLSVKKDIFIYMKREIAFDIRNNLLMGEIADCLSKNAKNDFPNGDLVLIVDRKNYWTKFAVRYLRKKKINFITINKFVLKRNKAVQLVSYFSLLCIEFFASFFRHKLKKRHPTIGIPHVFYDNFTEYTKKKNYYLFWQPESNIKTERIIVYGDKVNSIPLAERKRLDDSGIEILQTNGAFRKSAEHASKYRCTIKAIKILSAYFLQGLIILLRVRNKAQYEQWKILICLFVKLPYWEDFFSHNDIKIEFRSQTFFSHRDIAAKLAGAVNTFYHYSNHSPNNFSLTNHDICDTCFVWGKRYHQMLLSEHSAVNNIIDTGYIFDYVFKTQTEELSRLKEEFGNRGIKFIVGILDENYDGWNSAGMLAMQKEIFKFLTENSDIGAVIKPKKSYTRHILKTSEETSVLFNMLEKNGRLRVVDNLIYPAAVGKISDIAIGVYADSTAALECALTGATTIICECCYGEEPSHPYYRHKDKVVFYDSQRMLERVRAYKEKREKTDGFADWACILKEADSFLDGNANKRVGFYLKSLLEGFDSGLAKDDAIKRANGVYADKFGNDKVISLL